MQLRLKNQRPSLYERLESIDERLKIIIQALNDRSYSITQFCEVLGISRYSLKKLWIEKQLPIPEPKRMNGRNPIYTYQDLDVVREIIRS